MPNLLVYFWSAKFFGLLALIIILMVFGVELVSAQNSLGIGGTERVIKPTGPFAEILYWIQQQQKSFYKLMTGALKSIRSGHGGGWLLVGLSFAYGVLHAAGPGHGKAVIAMYMVANEVQLRRGILLSFISAFIQATVAILCIAMLVLVLRAIGYRSADVTQFLEVCSYAAITLIGLWLIWRKINSIWFKKQPNDHGHTHSHSHSHDHDHGDDPSYHHHPEHVCDAGCDHAHMPAPDQLSGKFDIKTAFATVMAVGIRPCSGALIVLTFAFLNSLHFYGMFSAYAMAVGTGLTVSAFAVLAVYGKQLASKMFTSDGNRLRFLNLVELAGAIFIFSLGLILLLAALQ